MFQIPFSLAQHQSAKFLREAENYRLAKQVFSARQRRNHYRVRALGWLGSRLVTVGQSLEARYDAHPHSFKRAQRTP